MAEPGACGKLQAGLYERDSFYGRDDTREHAARGRGHEEKNEMFRIRPLKGRVKKHEYGIAKAMPRFEHDLSSGCRKADIPFDV